MKYDAKPKKGRDTDLDLVKSSRETLENLPEYLVGKDILPNHILKKTGEAFVDDYESTNDEVQDTAVDASNIVNKSKFKRYHLPPEVQITHGRRSSKQIASTMTSDEDESEK